MTATVEQIRKGIKDALAGVPHLRAYATLPARPEPPCVAPIPLRWRYAQTFDGQVNWTFELWVYVSPNDINKAQLAYDAAMSPDGPNSIAAALQDDPTLGGVVDSLSVTGAEAYARRIEIPGSTELLGGALTLEVMVS